MPLKPITPQAAHLLVQGGAVLIDIRTADEHARERIAQAHHIPLEEFSEDKLALNGADNVIFHCRSGNRTQLNAQILERYTDSSAYVLTGGLDAWKKAGLPVITDSSQPLELSRQVHIAAGAMVLIGAILGATVSPWFHALSGFVGAGLVFAGISGFCGLARVLMKMPWNRKALTA